jgi:hypothetical protein
MIFLLDFSDAYTLLATNVPQVFNSIADPLGITTTLTPHSTNAASLPSTPLPPPLNVTEFP